MICITISSGDDIPEHAVVLCLSSKSKICLFFKSASHDVTVMVPFYWTIKSQSIKNEPKHYDEFTLVEATYLSVACLILFLITRDYFVTDSYSDV